MNKVLIQECMYADILQRLENRFVKVRTGNHLDKCNDYGPVLNSQEFKDILAKQVMTNGAQVKEFRENNDGSKLTPPTLIENAVLNSQFNLDEVNNYNINFSNFDFFYKHFLESTRSTVHMFN